MFKFVFLLCLLIAATLLTLGGRSDAPLRDGLAGKYAPLHYKDSGPVTPQPAGLAAAGQGPRPLSPGTGSAPARAVPQARPQPEPADSPAVSAAFATTGPVPEDALTAPGLTLALPAAEATAPDDPASQPPAPPLAGADAAPLEQYVLADSVNVRAGPSARTVSLTRLDRGDAVQVLPSDTPGWSKVRLERDGLEGFVASRFLGDPPQDGIFTPVN
jgi:hypothetical protein